MESSVDRKASVLSASVVDWWKQDSIMLVVQLVLANCYCCEGYCVIEDAIFVAELMMQIAVFQYQVQSLVPALTGHATAQRGRTGSFVGPDMHCSTL